MEGATKIDVKEDKRRWKPNPGKKEKPKNPNAMVWIRFVQIDPFTHKHYETDTKVKAGNYNWLDRGLPFDIKEASDDD